MQTPEPADLRAIERSHFRSIARRKLPTIRQQLADTIARKGQPDPGGHAMSTRLPKWCTVHFDRTSNEDVEIALNYLRQQFGDDWEALSCKQQVEVLVDFARMIVEEDWDSVPAAAIEYRTRIGSALLSYAKCPLLDADAGSKSHDTAKVVVFDDTFRH